MCNNPTTCTRVDDTLTLDMGSGRHVSLYAPKGGVDGQLWYTLAMALEMFLEDEWGGSGYPFDSIAVSAVVRTGPTTYRVTARDNAHHAPPVQYLLECDTDGSAYMYFA